MDISIEEVIRITLIVFQNIMMQNVCMCSGESALKGMIAAGTYTKERVECIHNLQVKEDDANPKYSKEIVKKYTKCVVVVIMHFQKNGNKEFLKM